MSKPSSKALWLLLLLFPFFQSCNIFNIDPITVELTEVQLVDLNIGKIVYIANNEVYLTDPDGEISVALTSDGTTKTAVRLSYDREKIAYLKAGGIPVILDTLGNEIATLSSFTNVKDFGWSGDNQTLYMLKGNRIEYYGPAMDVPDPVLRSNSYGIQSLAISSNGTMAYTETTNTLYYGTQYYVDIVLPGSLTSDMSFGPTTQEIWGVRFSTSPNELTFTRNNGPNNNILYKWTTSFSSPSITHDDVSSSPNKLDNYLLSPDGSEWAYCQAAGTSIQIVNLDNPQLNRFISTPPNGTFIPYDWK